MNLGVHACVHICECLWPSGQGHREWGKRPRGQPELAVKGTWVALDCCNTLARTWWVAAVPSHSSGSCGLQKLTSGAHRPCCLCRFWGGGIYSWNLPAPGGCRHAWAPTPATLTSASPIPAPLPSCPQAPSASVSEGDM